MEGNCKICGHHPSFLFTGKVLGKYQVRYYACAYCGFVQTEEPFWLEEAYDQSINLTDTGLVYRNIQAAGSVASLLLFLFDKHGKYLDYGGGYGLFARIMRDYGYDFYTSDPYTENLLAKGFDYDPSDNIDLVTTFESFEHFVHPMEEIEKIMAISKNIFFSTHLIREPAPPIDEWWYYGTDHGQHIAFYTGRTLQFIADKYHLYTYSLGRFHLFTERRISKLLFRLLTGAGPFGLSRMVPLFLRPRMIADMYTLKERSLNRP